MTDWIRTLIDCRGRGEPAVVVTVASVRGSAPREPGTRMVVTAQAQFGTIGGGHLEFQAIAIARDVIAQAHDAFGVVRRFPLGASLGQCCGGAVELMFEPIPPVGDRVDWLAAVADLSARDQPFAIVSAAGSGGSAGVLLVPGSPAAAVVGSLGSARDDADGIRLARDAIARRHGTRLVAASPDRCAWLIDPIRPPDFTVVLFGAGHVGRALVRLMADWPCRIRWIDPRAEEFPADVGPGVDRIVADDPVAEVDAAPAGSYFLVMTHSHPLDEALAHRILLRRDAAWFGLIGSLTKRRRFEHRLAGRGVDPARLAAMACPVGVPGITGKAPGIVAVAIAAQLLQVRARQATGTVERTGARS